MGGYPAGPMLEIAVRHTHSDKLEMFKWRSEFIAMLSAQPGPLVEREWHSVWGLPENTGAGTWTGMTWWENQQRWQDMANMLFPTPVAEKWLQTLDMTLVFVKPLDQRLRPSHAGPIRRAGARIGLAGLSDVGRERCLGTNPLRAETISTRSRRTASEVYRFAVYPNPSGFNGPFTVAYKKNGPPDTRRRTWFVYMASYDSAEARTRLQSMEEVHRAFEALTSAMVKEHSDIQVMTRTTSQVCIKKTTHDVFPRPGRLPCRRDGER